MELPLSDQFEETAFSKEPLGPSSRSICRVLNSGSCGSGTLVGFRNGKTLVLTNAHVAGTTIGRVVTCQFPFLNNRKVNAKVIMAGYSDRVMMDWAILEIDEKLALVATKLSHSAPAGDHYTGGYPRCEGPWFQRVVTKEITHNGTVWKWTPNSIGGQSGSGIHSFANHLQYGLLTWSWGGYGAGQTARSIWFQYANRAVVGFPRPDGLIELNDNRADGIEEGFFAEADITTLPIWAHLDDVTPPPPPPDGLAKAILAQAELVQKELDKLKEIAKNAPESDNSGNDANGSDSDGPTFGL